MRTRALSTIIPILFIILVLGLGYTQILRYKKYSVLSRTNRVRVLSVEGNRGRILDRNGILLVGNAPSFNALVIPQELEDSVNTLTRLGGILGIPAQEVFKRVEKNYAAPFMPILIKENIEKTEVVLIEEAHLAGVIVKVSPRREYRFNEAGSHIFGYLGEIDKAELERLKGYGYQIKDLVGKAGLEKSYDIYLRGEGGGAQFEVDNRGFFVRALGKKEAASGKDLFLTIDIRLQEFIDNLFGSRKGACVVMNPLTGEVLSLASRPSFNPNFFASRERPWEIARVLGGPDKAMLNRAISGVYPPGSVFKPVIAAAGLEKKKIDGRTQFFCGGKYKLGTEVFECWDEEGHGSQGVEVGLKNSCNVFFYQLGRLIGVEDISGYAARFGYGSPAGIDLPEEAAGLVPNKIWKRLVKKEIWFEGDTVNFSIGQGYALATPIQVLRMMAALSNGGNLPQPYIVKKIDGIEVVTAKSRYLGLSKATLDTMKSGLEMVVNDETGTGRRARVEGLDIAGKTGTAQNPRGASHAWFSGFSPVDSPRIVLVVFIEHGGKGGLEAAEFAGKVFQEAHRLGLL